MAKTTAKKSQKNAKTFDSYDFSKIFRNTERLSLNEFFGYFADAYLRPLVNKETGEPFMKLYFVDSDNKVASVSIKKSVQGWLDEESIVEKQEELVVFQTEDGNACLAEKVPDGWIPIKGLRKVFLEEEEEE